MAELIRKGSNTKETEDDSVFMGVSNPENIPMFVPQESVITIVELHEGGHKYAALALMLHLLYYSWGLRKIKYTDDMVLKTLHITQTEKDHLDDLIEYAKFY